MKRFIFTGAPGSGKTSVILRLEALEHKVIHEAATDVIAAEQAAGVMKPWEEFDFLDKIISLQKTRFATVVDNTVFCDRSIFCTYALAEYLALKRQIEFSPSILLRQEIERSLDERFYENRVFFFENLGFIENTEARQISFQDTLQFERIHLEVYCEFGFDIQMISKMSIAERCSFILSQMPPV